jgi:predicted DNA-binding transcriptional regulator AlpA
MASAARPAIAPLAPRLVGEETAAAYLGIGRSNFQGRWKRGDLPKPHRIGGRLLWDVRLLDRYVDALSGIGAQAGSWDDL